MALVVLVVVVTLCPDVNEMGSDHGDVVSDSSASSTYSSSSFPFARCLSTGPRIKASPTDAMPAENTRSNDVMQKCDIDWPICSHEPAR